jgi:SET domain-containing protein
MKSDSAFVPVEIGCGRTAPVRRCRSEFVGVAQEDGIYRLVVVRPVAAGTRLFRIEGRKIPRPTRYSIQVGASLHLDPTGGATDDEVFEIYFWRFMNHGCDPNTRVLGRDVIASRDIAPGEEATFNYNTTEYDLAESFACRCGSPRCGGTIGGFKHLPPDERERLRASLAPHLLRHLRPAVAAGRK